MAVKVGDLESELIGALCDRIRQKLPEDEAALAGPFVRQYYHWVPDDDLADRDQDQLYGAAMAHLDLARERKPAETKVRVYNPDFERDAFTSSHTLIDIVSDDMPFIVDSVTMELGRQSLSLDLSIHPVIRVRRDGAGRLLEVLQPASDSPGAIPESIFHLELVRVYEEDALARLEEAMRRVLDEVRATVEDWQPMRNRALEATEGLLHSAAPLDRHDRDEAKAFLEWVAEDHFTFIGYREYDLAQEGDTRGLRVVADSGLGILRRQLGPTFTPLRAKAIQLADDPAPLVLTKANARSTVHRPSRLDYIGVKRFDADGRVSGESRFLGLYTTSAYHESPREIPLLRSKYRRVLQRAALPPDSHDAKALVEILESYPRDALFQMGADDLFTIAIGLVGLGERQRVRLFVWHDPLDRFVSCVVTIPRDRFNTENRVRVGTILLEAFGGSQLDWTLQLTESLLVRVHYVVRCPHGVPERYDHAEIEERLARATRAWTDDLRDALIEARGEREGMALYRRYERAFPAAYRSDWAAQHAVDDVDRLEEMRAGVGPIIQLYRRASEAEELRCKLYSASGISLSDVVPTFEHMGARVMDERPYPIRLPASDGSSEADTQEAWIYDFGLRSETEDLEQVADVFQEVFLGARQSLFEDDGLNGLVLRAGLDGREITVLRAVARYLRQAGIAYSDAYMERTLLAHPDIARLLVKLFAARFDPDNCNPELGESLRRAMQMAIDGVESLDEDRILRSFLAVMQAMLRTNHYRLDEHGRPPDHVSFKLDPDQIKFLPKPTPQYEIFVYAPRFEGVHLRGGKVARGGLRWSDRPEDFRTEILGLMKAQMVKNALIVPVGAKGGFVLKRATGRNMKQLREEAIACYRLFLAGLLDITDNIVGGEPVAPDRVVRYDDEDTYLVVAADKGTAAFSDIANEISAEYDFWLGDAFASGGSHGYDHKQMGITARGAWESVKRHFRELGTDIQSTDFTVVGVGDMSGDVFGNGMLLSEHIRLVAAFNHRHVFLDPDPDAQASFAERTRLFETEGSSWGDYDRDAISAGGGVYERTAKSIRIGRQVREALAIEAEELSPSELITAILKAPVDLLFNGGIGTYVKASGESNADVGDKANDAVRVDGRELRCRVVGEGGNLGFTQLGRIEYARFGGPEKEGGKINTDSIDNVGGVNTSDHEVNIKILLDSEVAGGGLSEQDRNDLLVEMTDAVADAVLYNSYTQTQAISLALAQAAPMVDVHGRLIRRLEQVAGLDRELEFLPGEEEISERKAAHAGLVAPELAIVMAYTKIYLYGQLLESDLPEDPYLSHDLERYFPPPLPERYAEAMRNHRLRREIVATLVANQMVDRAGTTFAFRLGEETGASPARLARGYAAAREVFAMRPFWEEVEGLDNKVDAHVGLAMLIEGRRLVERATRWLVRMSPARIDIEQTVLRFRPGAELLEATLPELLDGAEWEAFESREAELRDAGVPADLARHVAAMPPLVPAFDIVEVASESGRDPETVMRTYFRLGSRLELNWLNDRIVELPRTNRWQALARSALRDDLAAAHRELTRQVLESADGAADPIEAWWERNGEQLERTLATLSDIRASRSYDTTTLPVALREVRALIRSGQNGSS
jgi:glutamate dehydrogenase